mmetsp:Transcript_22780/g.40319  ORF Transcript_22780/g.40319 Transcript_22780/m.40319 type:complete len:483 (+) Transcript_22780:147-1595(+)|eukprot:CAMPEP_0197541468 /NCGR_PEP_ID=MMETSP1318-20131121/67173_1 /TAXON_ID=552666 /ORGANISM="Partenskyella glossopodia, Strain RCC365" /LENGTH=482 /DNA_ID=CAMNT_0043100639 /DNA_START=83 /DNA_END=1531 /DNA_ORIENTATION=+
MHVGGLSINGTAFGRPETSRGEANMKSRHDSNTILFDFSKTDTTNPNKGLKQFQRNLKKLFQIKINKDDITDESLAGVRSVFIATPTSRFEPSEIKALHSYVHSGGSVFIMAQEGGEGQPNEHINKLTQEFGIEVNNDCLVRSAYRKDYFHPKEVYVAKASMTPEMDEYAGKSSPDTDNFHLDSQDDHEEETNLGGKLDILYPFGCTLTLERPAMPLITSGKMSFPANRALAGIAKLGLGVIIVMGSMKTFSDKYITKEDNMALMDGLVQMLTVEETKIGAVEPDQPEFKDTIQVPDMEALAERLRCCLQEPEDLPNDVSKMFDLKLFSYHTDMLPEAVKLYERLNVKHEPLSLIPPQFEVPLPPLQPAVFLPCMRDLPPPALDLFDLDQEFSGETVQLAQLTNKCSGKEDLDYYIVNAGRILNVTPKVGESGKEVTAKGVLEYIFKQLVNYKKMESEGSNMSTNSAAQPHSQILTQDTKTK